MRVAHVLFLFAAVCFAVAAAGIQGAGVQKTKVSTRRNEADAADVLASRGDAPSLVPLESTTVTMSGISAGAAFLIQYQLAFSSTIRAAGVVAGLPYNCAQGQLPYALTCMDSPSGINLDGLLTDATIYADAGWIDPLKNVENHTVMLWSGLDDTVVAHGTMLLVKKMYQKLGVERLVDVFNYSSEHAWITAYWGNACDHLGSPYINNCGYDFAGQFLSRAFAGMDEKWNPTNGSYHNSNMFRFDMGQFGADPWTNSLDTTGYIYVPTQCQQGNSSATKCHFHVNFHGCEQYRSNFPSDPTTYVAHTGLNQWAETNNIVILYPQTVSDMLMENPKGCFDWWGYTNSSYATKSGPQMSIVRAAVESLLGGK